MRSIKQPSIGVGPISVQQIPDQAEMHRVRNAGEHVTVFFQVEGYVFFNTFQGSYKCSRTSPKIT